MSHHRRADYRASLRALSLAGAGLFAAGQVAAQSTFFLGDWELACDNTRTCRAVGYQPEQDSGAPLALLVEREAGPDKAARLQVMLGRLHREPTAAFPSQVDLVIDGRRYGQVALAGGGATGDLAPTQSAVLLRAVLGTGDVTFEAPDDRWVLSTAGATSVLLRMDDLQGRVDTAGALVRKGSRPESTVLPAVPPPVVRAVPLVEPRPGDEALAERIRPLLAVGQGDYCEWLEAPKAGAAPEASALEPLTVHRLSADRVMVSMLCSQSGHHKGYGVWVAADKPPHAPKLVTTKASSIVGNTIESQQPNRDSGDCWNADSWTWDGRAFIHTSSSTTGMCKLVAAGGAWSLPTIVTSGGTTPGR